MENLLLDSAILAIPNYALSENNAQELFERVVHYADLARLETAFQIVLQDTAEEDLWAIEFGPDPQRIKDFVNDVGLTQVFSANDLLRAYQTIVSRSKRCSDVGGVDAQALSYFMEAPEVVATLEPAALIPLTQRSLTTAALLRSFDDSWTLASAFSGSGTREIEVRAVIDKLEGERASDIGPVPIGVFGKARIISKLCDFVCPKEAWRIWQRADEVRDLHLAILMGAYAVRKSHDPKSTVAHLLNFSIGSKFIAALKEHDCASAAKFASVTFQRCTQIVANLGNVTSNNFGTRTSDGATGKRVHLLKDHAGLRLMYWDCGQSIEFANVGVKKELAIEAGGPERPYTMDAGILFDS